MAEEQYEPDPRIGSGGIAPDGARCAGRTRRRGLVIRIVRAAKDGFFAVLAAEIGESPIPYDVYLVDLRYADPALLDDVPRKGVKWWSEHKTADWIIDLGPEGGD